MTAERYRLVDSRRSDEGWTFDVTVPAGSAFFTGHFPGRPVLPAIAQLTILDEVYAGTLVPGLVLAGIPRLKLQDTVQPDELLTYRVGHPDTAGQSRFTVEREGRPVTRGTIRWRERA